MKWMELKLMSSPIPDETNKNEYVNLLNDEYGLDLKLEDFSANPSMRSLGKLGLNSFWVR